ncbi:MAG: NAD(+)/NADH kinase [Clostridia bacterium]|nr:NAD(+)/NADH kinase [Clostridia bacterium]
MKLFLYPNALSEERRQAAMRCAARLPERFECYASAGNAAWLNPGACREGDPADCDAIMVFGGDGTMLRAARTALAANKPLLGVNTGRRGYLCALTEEDLPAFDEAALRALPVSPRTLIEYTWLGETRRALNELTIAKNDYGSTLDVFAALDGAPLGDWQGDGLLVATPTGSSAYNLSAGGPRLMPDSGCFVLTPLCPTGLNRAPIVISDAAALTLSAKPRFNPQEARVYADGAFEGILEGEITLRRAAQRLMLLQRRA